MSNTQSQWIPVSERLPEDVSKPYLVLTTEGKTPAVAHRGKGRSWFSAIGRRSWLPNVTHWMDLPEPPAPPKPADPFEAWWHSYPTCETQSEAARAAWNAAKEHYAKPLPDFDAWWDSQERGFVIRTTREMARHIWNAAQGKPEA